MSVHVCVCDSCAQQSFHLAADLPGRQLGLLLVCAAGCDKEDAGLRKCRPADKTRGLKVDCSAEHRGKIGCTAEHRGNITYAAEYREMIGCAAEYRGRQRGTTPREDKLSLGLTASQSNAIHGGDVNGANSRAPFAGAIYAIIS